MGMVFGKTGVAEPAYDLLLTRTPPSSVIPYEIRRYGERFAIETEYAAENDMGKAFMTLAGYIGVRGSPQNEGHTGIAMTAPVVTGGEAIAMTAPVVTTNDKAAKKTMQFFLPEEYDELSKIPKPTNPNVVVSRVAPAVGAVHRFSGWVKEDQARERASNLVQQLHRDGATVAEEVAMEKYGLWQYNPPFTIPALRRNEVWVELTDQEVDAILEKFRKDKVKESE